MPPKPTNWRMYGKMALAGVVCCVGGPALVYYLSPTEEELFLRYNPELQKRSLENRVGRQQEFDQFVGRLKEYSKSDKQIWEAAAEAAAEAEKLDREDKFTQQSKLLEEVRARKEEIRKSGSRSVSAGGL